MKYRLMVFTDDKRFQAMTEAERATAERAIGLEREPAVRFFLQRRREALTHPLATR